MAHQRTLDATTPGLDHVAVEVRLIDYNRYVDSLRTELRKPTTVTPCRPYDATASQSAYFLRRLVADWNRLFGLQLTDLHRVSVEHVIDLDRCRAATETMAAASQTTAEGWQVHLYRLGDRGWAALEASHLGHYTILSILDADLSVVRKSLAF